jgi:hypothetical protein
MEANCKSILDDQQWYMLDAKGQASNNMPHQWKIKFKAWNDLKWHIYDKSFKCAFT